MFTNIFFLLGICAIPIYLACKQIHFSFGLPLTLLGASMVLFLTGIVNQLHGGAYLLLALAVLAYILFFGEIWKHRSNADFFTSLQKCLLNPAFAFFILSYFFFAYALQGMKAVGWDDFSHWVDTVKVLFLHNTFGAHASHPHDYALFASYPPGASVLQYFYLQIGKLLGNAAFAEWPVYFVYHIIYIGLLLPVFSKITWKQWPMAIATGFTLWLFPLAFIDYFYTAAYIDSLLIAAIALNCMLIIKPYTEKSMVHTAMVVLAIAYTVLLKDIGFYFAFCICLIHIIIVWTNKKTKTIRSVLWLMLALLLPKLLWFGYLRYNASSLAFKNYSSLMDILNIPYAIPVIKTYLKFVLSQSMWVFGLPLCAILWYLLAFTCLYFVLHSQYKNQQQNKLLFWGLFIMSLCYGICLPIIYIINFSQKEALRLAEVTRYLMVPLASVYVTSLLLFLQNIAKHPKAKQWAVLCIGLVLIFSNSHKFAALANRSASRHSIELRTEIDTFITGIEGKIPENARVYIVSQNRKKDDWWALHMGLKPRFTNPNYTESYLVEPLISPEAFLQSLQNYDYLVIHSLDTAFANQYHSLFENGNVKVGVYAIKTTQLVQVP